MSLPDGPHDVVYVHTDIPAGMTIREWRRARATHTAATVGPLGGLISRGQRLLGLRRRPRAGRAPVARASRPAGPRL